MNSILDFEIIINAYLKSAFPTIFLGIIDFFIIGNYQSNRGFERFGSSYGDIATLGIQLNLIMIIIYYNILKEDETYFGKYKNFRR